MFQIYVADGTQHDYNISSGDNMISLPEYVDSSISEERRTPGGRKYITWQVRCPDCKNVRMVSSAHIKCSVAKGTFTGFCRRCCLTKKGGPRSRKPGYTRINGGYVHVRVPHDSPFISMASRGELYIAQHRLVMAEHLGRVLTRHEFVHHIDGDKANNAIENLKIMSNSEHASMHSKRRAGDKRQRSHK